MKQAIRYLKPILTALLVIVGLLSAIPLPVYAIADPVTPPSVNAVYTYEDCYADGDLGVLIDYYLDYSTIPTTNETATESYIAIFVDTDNITQLKAVAPYTYHTSGYRAGLIWMYFTPAEVTAFGLTSANTALYGIWLMGNPTVPSGWTGAVPKTIAGIDEWNSTGDPHVLIALKVLYYADQLELAWSLDLIQETAIGSRLTTLGESYFTNVITNLRTIAPACFASTTTDPTLSGITYDTAFGARAESLGATIIGSPVTLVSGTNTIDTGATTGTIKITLAQWTSGNVTDAGGVVTGSPAPLNPGVNTLTVTGAGTLTVNVAVVDTITRLDASVIGTGMDLTTLATMFGMSRWMLSGLIWILISIIICGGVYLAGTPEEGMTPGAGKVIMLVFSVCVIGGTLLGMLSPLISAFLFIGCGAMIGYVFFFKSETLHKGYMFMAWMWLIVSLAGNVVAGNSTIVATRLTSGITATEVNSIPVASTTGFASAGAIVIGDEKIMYPKKTALAFEDTDILGITTNPIMRGQNNTTAAAHSANVTVRTVEAAILNASVDYKIARIVDTAGLLDFVTLPLKLLDLLLTFFILPLDFLGTDLAILAYIWIVVAAGMVVGFVTAVIGSRRV